MRLSTRIRISCLTLGLGLVSTATFAQAFEQGTNSLGASVGIGGAYSGIGFSGSGVSQTPAIGLHFDHGMGDLGAGVWGLGGFVGYKKISYSQDYLGYYKYDYSWTYLIIGARGTWHYNEWHGDKLDTYGGLMLSYNAVTYKDNTNYGTYGNLGSYTYGGSGMGFTGFLGLKYYFNDKFGAFTELGYGVAFLQLGLTLKV